MCHQSPTVALFAALMATSAVFVLGSHIYKYDGGKCLRPSLKNLFRCVMVYMLIIAALSFLCYAYIESYIKYKVGFTYLPTAGVYPTPHQTWTDHYASLWRASYWILALAWSSLICVHLEEFLYWGYMIRACQNSHNQTTWFKSIWFKLWLGGSMIATGVIFGSLGISSDLQDMETYLFFVGSLTSLLLVAGSVWIALLFPKFIADATRLGANAEVLSRLLYVKELNIVRTVFRAIYAVAVFIISADGLTKGQAINHTHIGVDILFLVGFLAVFAATLISLWILLPRTYSSSTLPSTLSNPNVGLVRQTYKPPGRRRASTNFNPTPGGIGNEMDEGEKTEKGWNLLGNRLNLDTADVEDLAEIASTRNGDRDGDREREESFYPDQAPVPVTARGLGYEASEQDGDGNGFEMVKVPTQLDRFKSPLDVGSGVGPRVPVDLKIMVTSEVVENRD